MALTYGFCLGEYTDSKQFSEAFYQLVGDGVTPDGKKLESALSGFTLTVQTGYALAAGRWVKNDWPYEFTLEAAGNTDDRIDALAVRVDYFARKAALVVLVDIDLEAVRENPELLRTENEYCILLYAIRMRRGAMTLSPEDIIDLRSDKTLCGMIARLSDVSADVLYVYDYLTTGLDEDIRRLLAYGDKMLADETNKVNSLKENVKAKRAAPSIGDLRISYAAPKPAAEWILCNGGRVPSAYQTLGTILNWKLPNLCSDTDRRKIYIYGGTPS